MSKIVDFIKTNIRGIVVMVVIVLFLLVLINIKGINLNEPKPASKLVQRVTVETFDSDESITKNDNRIARNFCDNHTSYTS